MLMIRKILKANLKDLDPTNDIILSITDTDELFYNTKQGKQRKLNDVTIVSTEAELSNTIPVSGRLYFIKETSDLKIYINKDIKYMSITKEISDMITVINNKITVIDNNIKSINNTINNNSQNVNREIENINTTLDNVNTSIANINETISKDDDFLESLKSNLPDELNSIEQNILELQENSSTNITDIEKLKTQLNSHITEFNTFKEIVSDKIASIETNIENANNNIGTLKLNMSNAQANITTLINSITTQRFNHSIPIKGPVSGDINNNEFSIYDYIVNDDYISLGCINIKSKLVYANNITVKLFYLPEYEDNSIGQPELVASVNLIAGNYINSFIIEQQSNYNKGYFRVNITNPQNEELDLIVLLELVKTVNLKS